MRWDIIILVLLLGALAFLGFLLYDNLPRKAQTFVFVGEKPNLSKIGQFSDYFPQGMQFYPNMRYAKLPITYSFKQNCGEEKIQRMKQAIKILKDETGLQFLETKRGQIIVSCSEVPPELEERMFIAGEGVPNTIINTSLYYVILNGSIFLYKTDYCKEPIVELHELLHALGFQHSLNEKSILYNISDCNQKLTQDIINELKELYNVPSLPELFFNDVQAIKRGKYIDFQIEIVNAGLIASNKTELSVYSNDAKLGIYNITAMEIGYGIKLKIENLRASRSTKILKFVIDEKNKVKEIDESNNLAIMNLK